MFAPADGKLRRFRRFFHYGSIPNHSLSLIGAERWGNLKNSNHRNKLHNVILVPPRFLTQIGCTWPVCFHSYALAASDPTAPRVAWPRSTQSGLEPRLSQPRPPPSSLTTLISYHPSSLSTTRTQLHTHPTPTHPPQPHPSPPTQPNSQSSSPDQTPCLASAPPDMDASTFSPPRGPTNPPDPFPTHTTPAPSFSQSPYRPPPSPDSVAPGTNQTRAAHKPFSVPGSATGASQDPGIV